MKMYKNWKWIFETANPSIIFYYKYKHLEINKIGMHGLLYILYWYLVGFFLFAEISEILKKNRLEKLVFPVKWSAWLYASTLQNFARQHFFNVNEVSIVILWERNVETGENMWKVSRTKAWAWWSGLISSW